MVSKKDNLPKRFDPSPFHNLMEQMDSLFNESFRNFNALFDRGTVQIDMHETDTDVIIEARLPGYSREQIQLETVGNSLRIAAEDNAMLEEKNDKDNYHNRRRSFHRMERWVTLPFAISEKETKASYNNGILTITTPKRNTGKTIDID